LTSGNAGHLHVGAGGPDWQPWPTGLTGHIHVRRRLLGRAPGSHLI